MVLYKTLIYHNTNTYLHYIGMCILAKTRDRIGRQNKHTHSKDTAFKYFATNISNHPLKYNTNENDNARTRVSKPSSSAEAIIVNR